MKAKLLSHKVEDDIDRKAVESIADRAAKVAKDRMPWAKVEATYSMGSMQHVVRAAAQMSYYISHMIDEHTDGDHIEYPIEQMKYELLKAVERDPAVQALLEERQYISRTKVAQIAQLLGGAAAVQLLELVHNLKD